MFGDFVKIVVFPLLLTISLALTVEKPADFVFGVFIGLVLYRIFIEDKN